MLSGGMGGRLPSPCHVFPIYDAHVSIIRICSISPCRGDSRPFKENNAIKLAHSDESYMQENGEEGRIRFHELDHESKVRLPKPIPTPLNDEAVKPVKTSRKMIV